MPGTVVIRVIDERVGRNFVAPTANDHLCTATTALKPFFEGIVAKLGSDKIALLLLMTHAFYNVDPSDGGHRYGFGVELGAEGLHNGALDVLSPLVGKFAPRAVIELRGCGVAVKSVITTPRMKVGNGIALCQEIADLTRAIVIASSDEQPGTCEKVIMETTKRGPNGYFVTETATTVEKCAIGDWTGQVWHFTPGAATPKPANVPSLPRQDWRH